MKRSFSWPPVLAPSIRVAEEVALRASRRLTRISNKYKKSLARLRVSKRVVSAGTQPSKGCEDCVLSL